MKLFLWTVLLFGTLFVGCKDNSIEQLTDTPVSSYKNLPGTLSYQIDLLGGAPVDNGDGTYTWTWRVINNAPGNGKPGTGTYQDLGHWSFVPASLTNADIVSAAYGLNNPPEIAVTNPLLKRDPSISACSEEVLFTFDYGTTGSTPSYYSITINTDYCVDNSAVLYWKSGITCSPAPFDGIGTEQLPCNEENAWTDGIPYFPGSSAKYTPYVPGSTVQLLGEGNRKAGTVHLSNVNNGQVTITLTLRPGWQLKNTSDPVQVQDYFFPPYGIPNPALFKHKSAATVLVVPMNRNYGVHVDLQYCEPSEAKK